MIFSTSVSDRPRQETGQSDTDNLIMNRYESYCKIRVRINSEVGVLSFSIFGKFIRLIKIFV